MPACYPRIGFEPRWAEKRFTDIRYWGEPGRGGHFAASGQLALFADELRSFFRLVRLAA